MMIDCNAPSSAQAPQSRSRARQQSATATRITARAATALLVLLSLLVLAVAGGAHAAAMRYRGRFALDTDETGGNDIRFDSGHAYYVGDTGLTPSRVSKLDYRTTPMSRVASWYLQPWQNCYNFQLQGGFVYCPSRVSASSINATAVRIDTSDLSQRLPLVMRADLGELNLAYFTSSASTIYAFYANATIGDRVAVIDIRNGAFSRTDGFRLPDGNHSGCERGVVDQTNVWVLCWRGSPNRLVTINRATFAVSTLVMGSATLWSVLDDANYVYLADWVASPLRIEVVNKATRTRTVQVFSAAPGGATNLGSMDVQRGVLYYAWYSTSGGAIYRVSTSGASGTLALLANVSVGTVNETHLNSAYYNRWNSRVYLLMPTHPTYKFITEYSGGTMTRTRTAPAPPPSPTTTAATTAAGGNTTAAPAGNSSAAAVDSSLSTAVAVGVGVGVGVFGIVILALIVVLVLKTRGEVGTTEPKSAAEAAGAASPPRGDGAVAVAVNPFSHASASVTAASPPRG
jgi:hypothetical protein